MAQFQFDVTMDGTAQSLGALAIAAGFTGGVTDSIKVAASVSQITLYRRINGTTDVKVDVAVLTKNAEYQIDHTTYPDWESLANFKILGTNTEVAFITIT